MCKQIHTCRLQNTILTEKLTALCDNEHNRVKSTKMLPCLRFSISTGKGPKLKYTASNSTFITWEQHKYPVSEVNIQSWKKLVHFYTISCWGPQYTWYAHTRAQKSIITHIHTHILVQCQPNSVIAQNFSGLRQELWSLAWLRLHTPTQVWLNVIKMGWSS